MGNTIRKELLTISIPTYNRKRALLKTLGLLLPQLNNNCYLQIIDNASDEPVQTYITDLLNSYVDLNYEIVTNKVNIGGDSNIIRCFELCDTEWLWTLGDDDEIEHDAIATIFNDIARYPEVYSINYNSPHELRPKRDVEIINSGRYAFLKNTDSLGSLIYISCNIYQMKFLKKDAFWQANQNTYSSMSQWIILFLSLESKSSTIFSNKVICINPVLTEGNEAVVVRLAKGVSTLLDIPMGLDEKKLFINHLKIDIYRLATIDAVIKNLLLDYFKSGGKLELIFLFRKLYYSLYQFLGIKFKFKYYIYLTSLRISKKATFKIIRYLYLKKRNIDLNKLI